MSATEAQRHELFEAAKAVFGEANAETFMNLQPTVDPNEVATKNDLRELGSELRLAMAELKSDFRSELHQTIWISQAAFAAFLSAVFTIVTVFG